MKSPESEIAEAKEGQAVYLMAVDWLEKRGWVRASNQSMMWRKANSGAWMSFGDAFMLQLRYDGAARGYDKY